MAHDKGKAKTQNWKELVGEGEDFLRGGVDPVRWTVGDLGIKRP